MMEFAMAFPLVLVLILGCVQMAHLWLAKLATTYASYCAARAALVTVTDEAGPSPSNDSWPTRDELPFEGLEDPFTRLGSIGAGYNGRAKSEAGWAACQAAERVCRWSVLGASGNTMADRQVPNWGRIPGSDAAGRKVRATVQFQNWNVVATVEHDFALVMPIVGPMIAWGMNPWDDAEPWKIQTVDPTDDAHKARDLVAYPHIRLKAVTWMPKPYRTAIAAGNWQGSPPAGGGRW